MPLAPSKLLHSLAHPTPLCCYWMLWLRTQRLPSQGVYRYHTQTKDLVFSLNTETLWSTSKKIYHLALSLGGTAEWQTVHAHILVSVMSIRGWKRLSELDESWGLAQARAQKWTKPPITQRYLLVLKYIRHTKLPYEGQLKVTSECFSNTVLLIRRFNNGCFLQHCSFNIKSCQTENPHISLLQWHI